MDADAPGGGAGVPPHGAAGGGGASFCGFLRRWWHDDVCGRHMQPASTAAWDSQPCPTSGNRHREWGANSQQAWDANLQQAWDANLEQAWDANPQQAWDTNRQRSERPILEPGTVPPPRRWFFAAMHGAQP
eukprot:gene6849-1489_t